MKNLQIYGLGVKVQNVLGIFPSLLSPFVGWSMHQVYTRGVGLPSKDLFINLVNKIHLYTGSTRGVLINKKVAGFKVKKESDTILVNDVKEICSQRLITEYKGHKSFINSFS